MQLQLQNFTTLVGNAVAAIQGAAAQLLDLTVGSALRAIVEANASLALWMQWLIVQVLRATRAATSQGADLDSWTADFGVSRVAAVCASGSVTFARFSPVAAALIPVLTLVKTADGTQSFEVVADATNPAYVYAQNGYVLGAGIASLAVAVRAVMPGGAGNVQPGGVSLIAAAIPGVDTVTNASALAGGQDAESDAALRERFALFLASRTQATPVAIAFAVASVQQGLATLLVENQTPDGSVRPGSFTLTVDDGSGAPGADLLAAIGAAIEAVRPLGSSFAVVAPAVLRPTVAMTIATGPGADHATLAAKVAAAVAATLGQLQIGAVLPFSRLAAIAYAADPAVTNVTNITLDGGTGDLAPPPGAVIKPGPITVT
jgi:uncharacterized phage protein gp47/JayE